MIKRKFYFAIGFEGEGLTIPTRATKHSAGYDISAAEDVVIKPFRIATIPTGIKVKLPDNEFLGLYLRSSTPERKKLIMPSPGIVDSDFFNNPINDGAIVLKVWNLSWKKQIINKGERIAQGIFQEYKLSDDDDVTNKRVSGLGSTGF